MNAKPEVHGQWTLEPEGRFTTAESKMYNAEMYVDETYVYFITDEGGTMAVPRTMLKRLLSLHDAAAGD